MSTELHVNYTARNSERWQPKPSSPAGISRAARITKDREKKQQEARAALAAIHAARLEQRIDIALFGSPMERGILALDEQVTSIREAYNLNVLFTRDWVMRGMLEIARAFDVLQAEEIERFRGLQHEAFDTRYAQLETRLEA